MTEPRHVRELHLNYLSGAPEVRVTANTVEVAFHDRGLPTGSGPGPTVVRVRLTPQAAAALAARLPEAIVQALQLWWHSRDRARPEPAVEA